MMTRLLFRLNLILILLIIGLAIAQNVGNRPPEVRNLFVQQRPGTRLVDIHFDLLDPDGDLLSVEVEASDDNGATWNITPQTLSGDVGEGIAPGNRKRIVWDVGTDLAGIKNPNFKVRLIVDDGKADTELPEEITWEKDGATMRLIPAGEFEMGDAFNEGDADERPVHTIYLDDFYIDVTEVTNAQFKRFVDANPQWRKNSIPREYHDGSYLEDWNGNTYPSGKGDHPVVWVSWYGAAAYVQWAGKRLPTEAEWEKAARGGLVGKRYPWGDEISHDDANYWGTGGRDQWQEETAPVGSFPPNGYGLYDMAGNVWEWCMDEYQSTSCQF